MSGGRAGLLPRFNELLGRISLPRDPYSADQIVLASVIWPLVREDAVIHDSWFRLPGSQPFPDGGRAVENSHVGAVVFPPA